MSVEKVFLIKPAYKDSYYKYNDLPAGLGYISQALLDAGIDNTVFDMNLKPGFESLVGEIQDCNPQLIALSLMSYRFLMHYDLIGRIRDRFPDIPILVGGPHVSTFREEVLRKCGDIDYGVTLEGERTIVELCKGKSPKDIKGLLYREGDGVVYTGDRPFIDNLDDLAFPRYEKFKLDSYDFITIITSRGCPFKCIYCPVLCTIGNRWRYRSATSVTDEIEFWYRKGVRRFEFGDDNFTLKRERVVAICDEIERRGLKGLNIGLGNGIRADRVDYDLLVRMKEVGFSYVAFGVEAGNNRVLKALKKGETIEQIEAGIKAACDAGFPVHLFFLLGAPSETEEDVKDSVRLALKYPVVDVAFYNILPFPQSELYDLLLNEKRFIRSPEEHLNDSSHWVFSPVFETPELSVDDRIRLLEWANRVTGEHTGKVLQTKKIEKLENKGIPRPFAKLLLKTKIVEHLYNRVFKRTG